MYRLDAPPRKEGVAVLLNGLVRSKTLLDNWDELLRVAASLLISKLQTGARENVLSRALRDLGRLVKTQFILRWIENPDYRRRIHRHLNKGEALHALRRFLFFAHEGKVQRRQADQQTNQVLCLNLVTNAIVTWNTVYMNAAIERLELSSSLRQCLGTTNIIESHHSGVRMRTRRVSRWKDGKMVLRWVASAFLETEKHFRRIQGYRDLWMLKARLRDEVTMDTQGKIA